MSPSVQSEVSSANAPESPRRRLVKGPYQLAIAKNISSLVVIGRLIGRSGGRGQGRSQRPSAAAVGEIYWSSAF